MKGGGSGWEYANIPANDVGDWTEFVLLIWKLQGDTVRNLYLTQKSMDSLFTKFLVVWQHLRPKITPQIPEKVSFS